MKSTRHTEYSWGYPIYQAVVRRDKKMIRFLLKSGANLDVYSDDMVQLFHPIGFNIPDMVKFMLEVGADPNVQSIVLRRTALHEALYRQRSLESARWLIEYGADLFIKNWHGNTPIDYAVIFDCDEILAMMVAARSQPNAYGRRFQQPGVPCSLARQEGPIATRLTANARGVKL